jgi:hypothetical protein
MPDKQLIDIIISQLINAFMKALRIIDRLRGVPGGRLYRLQLQTGLLALIFCMKVTTQFLTDFTKSVYFPRHPFEITKIRH